jgi:hypothetical protein
VQSVQFYRLFLSILLLCQSYWLPYFVSDTPGLSVPLVSISPQLPLLMLSLQLHSSPFSFALLQLALSDFLLRTRCFRGDQTADQKRSCSHSAALVCGSAELARFSRLSPLHPDSPICESLILSHFASRPQSLTVFQKLFG